MNPKDNSNGRELAFGDAIRKALAGELRRNPRVFMVGEDIAEAGTTFKILHGLVEDLDPNGLLIRRFPTRGLWAGRRRGNDGGTPGKAKSVQVKTHKS